MAIANSPQPKAEGFNSAFSIRHSRRHLMSLAAAAGVSLAAMRMFSPSKSLGAAATPAATPALTGGPTDGATQFAAIPGNSIDEKVLNFALTLETLEANLYKQALNLASGYPAEMILNVNPAIYSNKVGGGGLSKGGTDAGYLYLKQYAYVEGSHRDFLRAAMTAAGFTPVPQNPGGYVFPVQPAANIKSILTQILPLEEAGTRAYLGALPYLDDLGLATTAATIYSQECRHSAAISYLLGIDPGPMQLSGDLEVVSNPPASNTFEPYLQPATVVAAIQAYFVK